MGRRERPPCLCGLVEQELLCDSITHGVSSMQSIPTLCSAFDKVQSSIVRFSWIFATTKPRCFPILLNLIRESCGRESQSSSSFLCVLSGSRPGKWRKHSKKNFYYREKYRFILPFFLLESAAHDWFLPIKGLYLTAKPLIGRNQ